MYADDRRLCIVTVAKEYLAWTKLLLHNKAQFFPSSQKPHTAVSRETISQWLCNDMLDIGLNMDMFTPHSLGGASAGKASKAKVPINILLPTAS